MAAVRIRNSLANTPNVTSPKYRRNGRVTSACHTLRVARTHVLRPLALTLAGILALGIVTPASAQGGNDALLRLLRILRDRGSISSEEYERKKADLLGRL